MQFLPFNALPQRRQLCAITGLPQLKWARNSIVISTMCWPAVSLAATTPAVGGDDRVHLADFRITLFASGLNYPTSMQQLPDGSLLIATNAPGSTPGLFSTSGELRQFIDANHDGFADDPVGSLRYSGLPGPVTSVRIAGSLILATSQSGNDSVITVLKKGVAPGDAYQSMGSVTLSFTSDHEHRSYALATQEVAGAPGRYNVFFNVGSRANSSNTTSTVPISYSGLTGPALSALNADSIYKFTIDSTAPSPAVSNLVQVATGLRNASGIQVHPSSGALYFEDNGIDGLQDRSEPLSVDELNVIPANGIGSGIHDFGFADNYVPYRGTDPIGTRGEEPIATFQPINGSESEGPNEIAIAPAGFPTGLNDGIFVGFHGQYNQGGVANEENPVVYWDRLTGKYFQFISNDEADIGHPDGLLATQDSLFIADLSSSGELFMMDGNGQGAIYQIQAVTPEPATALFGCAALPLLLRRVRART